MASDLSKAKRKRTAKKNIVIKNILPECETILNEYRSEEAIQEVTMMVQTLEQLQLEVRILEDIVADLIEDEDELEKRRRVYIITKVYRKTRTGGVCGR